MSGKTWGQLIVERIEGYITRYVYFDGSVTADQALVCALWVLHTWVSERFPVTPYLCITASTKQAGKTLLQQVIGQVCRVPKHFATIRALMVARCIETFDTHCTLFFDEAERLASKSIGDERSMMAQGYKQGATHGISVGSTWTEFRVFCSKCFALIGDMVDILRDRSIVIYLRRGKAPADFLIDSMQGVVEDAANGIKSEILSHGIPHVDVASPEFLTGRDREIWTPLYSLALGLGFDAATMKRLEGAMLDLCEQKKAPARSYHDSQAETDAEMQTYGDKVLIDLAGVFTEGERHVSSAEAVKRLRGLSTSPWRRFKGEGLTELSLSALLRGWGVKPTRVRIGSGRKASTVLMGYKRSEVAAAVEGMTVIGKGGAA